MNTQDIIIGSKAILTGLFEYNNQTNELDDSFFIPMVKEWISNITENFENVDMEEEKKAAREEFISYYE